MAAPGFSQLSRSPAPIRRLLRLRPQDIFNRAIFGLMTGVSLIPQVAVLGADYFARFDTLTTDSAADDDLVADFESDGLRVVQA